MAGPGRLGTLSVAIKVARLCAVMIMSGERNGSVDGKSTNGVARH
jgi:hypothetical protein